MQSGNSSIDEILDGGSQYGFVRDRSILTTAE